MQFNVGETTMRTWICVLLVLLLAGMATAKPIYFMSTGGQVNHDESGALKAGLGGDVELGLRSRDLEVFTGYHVGSLPGADLYNEDSFGYDSPYGNADHHPGWTGRSGDVVYERAIFGVRLLNALPQGVPICGFAGTGLSLGRTRIYSVDARGLDFGETPRERTDVSGVSAGWFAELGVRLRPMQSLSFDIGFQHHSFDAVFPTVDFTSTHRSSVKVLSGFARMVYTL